MLGAAPGRGRDRRRSPCSPPRLDHRVAGQERREVRGDADRAHAGAAAAVRDAEGLVQVEVADVGADVARAAQADLRVHVGAVHVDLAAVLVDDLADLLDALLEDAVRRRVGDHQRGELVLACSCAFASRSARSMLPCASHATTTTFMPAMTRWRGLVPCAEVGIRQTSRCACAAALVVAADDEQAGVLALRAGVRLQRHGGEAGDLGEPWLELARRARGSPASARRARTGGGGRTPAR